ncbi:hypothetical protein Hanom_Chr12g01068081 [Helianthus anomalus]
MLTFHRQLTCSAAETPRLVERGSEGGREGGKGRSRQREGSASACIHIVLYVFFLNGKLGSLTDHWSIIVSPAEPPDHIHLH